MNMAGLLARGSMRHVAFPVSQWHRDKALSAHSRGGGRGFGPRFGSPAPHSHFVPLLFLEAWEPCSIFVARLRAKGQGAIRPCDGDSRPEIRACPNFAFLTKPKGRVSCKKPASSGCQLDLPDWCDWRGFAQNTPICCGKLGLERQIVGYFVDLTNLSGETSGLRHICRGALILCDFHVFV